MLEFRRGRSTVGLSGVLKDDRQFAGDSLRRDPSSKDIFTTGKFLFAPRKPSHSWTKCSHKRAVPRKQRRHEIPLKIDFPKDNARRGVARLLRRIAD